GAAGSGPAAPGTARPATARAGPAAAPARRSPDTPARPASRSSPGRPAGAGGRWRRSLAGPADGPERLVDAAVGRDGDEALVALAGDVDLLREVEEDVGRVLHQDPRELGVVLLPLCLVGGPAGRFQGLVGLGVLVVPVVPALPLARVPDRVGEGVGVVMIRPAHDDGLEVRGEELLHERGPVERLESRLDAHLLQVLLD